MALRSLANENIPGDVVEAIRGLGHDVAWVRIGAPGSRDETVLARAQSEERVVRTFDKDFGDLAFHSRLPASSGIILFRIAPTTPRHTLSIIVAALGARSDWPGHFSVVEFDRIRMTPLPQRKPQVE